MADSYLKKENNKKKAEKAKLKAQRREERKSDNNKGGEPEFMYVDEFGQLTSTPPTERTKIELEDIQLGAAKIEEEELVKTGVVDFLSDKGYGFIKENVSKETIFFHVNNIDFDIKQGHKVSFEKERGDKGYVAANVKLLK